MSSYRSAELIEVLTKLLVQHYGISGDLMLLDGYDDVNVCLKNEDSKFLVKLIKNENSRDYVKFQSDVLAYLQDSGFNSSQYSYSVPTLEGSSFINVEIGNVHYILTVRTWVDGGLLRHVNPITDQLKYAIGQFCGKLTSTLFDSSFTYTNPIHKWDIANLEWVTLALEKIEPYDKDLVSHFLKKYEPSQRSYLKLRKSIIHNDANPSNIIVDTTDLKNINLVGIIDFGDSIYTQSINDVAVLCAYFLFGSEDPIRSILPVIKGYHEEFQLSYQELEHLFACIVKRLILTLVNGELKKKSIEASEYHDMDVNQAREMLNKLKNVDEEYAYYSFRKACGLGAHPKTHFFKKLATTNPISLKEIFPTLGKVKVYPLDLSVSSLWLGHFEDYNDLDFFQYKLDKIQTTCLDCIISGGYMEPRPIYTSDAYNTTGANERTVHMGIDFWVPAYTPVHSPFPGEVVSAVNNAGNKEYGGLIILKHLINEIEFFSLYGHLTVESARKWSIGDRIEKGQKLAEIGLPAENGNWATHLHFQIMLTTLNYKDDFPGVVDPLDLPVMKDLIPDPNLFFKLEKLGKKAEYSFEKAVEDRKKYLGAGLKLHYNKPLEIVRGSGCFLIDPMGRKYLDTVNNVPHVGHQNHRIVKAGKRQMNLLNTNTRYLHNSITELAKELLATFPEEFTVVHFVNSGSEANELAMRMINAHGNGANMVVSQHGYHGNTSRCIEISSYKYDGKGGSGRLDHVFEFLMPDIFRGRYTDKNAVDHYIDYAIKEIRKASTDKRGLGGLIVEPILSCGGQVVLPPGFLKAVYEEVRRNGGLCISDEIQVGLGRMGDTFWGFQYHDVVPDIVTIGKPLGNGHPIAAVVCTTAVADKFNNGMEYFNTFGGNPVSCAIALEVLQTVKSENLQVHAQRVGQTLKNKLNQLKDKYPIIADVRGVGLFLGFELCDTEKKPLSAQANYLCNRMRELNILMNSDGPDDNVIKIKPPLTFGNDHVDFLINTLEKVLQENFMQTY